MSIPRDIMLDLVRAAWDEYPQWRLGQVVANAAARGGEPPHTDPFYVSDERMVTGLRELARRPAEGD